MSERQLTEDESNKAVQFLISTLTDVVIQLSMSGDAPHDAALRERCNELRHRAIQAAQNGELDEMFGLIGEVSGLALQQSQGHTL